MSRVVAVDMPRKGKRLAQFDEIGIVESTRVSSEILTPVSGVVVGSNDLLDANPMLVNDYPYVTDGFSKLKSPTRRRCGTTWRRGDALVATIQQVATTPSN